jgi:hypothetical protein
MASQQTLERGHGRGLGLVGRSARERTTDLRKKESAMEKDYLLKRAAPVLERRRFRRGCERRGCRPYLQGGRVRSKPMDVLPAAFSAGDHGGSELLDRIFHQGGARHGFWIRPPKRWRLRYPSAD